MRSWENRPDAIVVDEPLYAHYLAETGLDHPGRDEVVATGETDWRVVVDELLGPLPPGVDVFYQKHMAHHLLADIDRAWLSRLTNVLLIRDPREVVASYVRSRVHVAADDLGVSQQAMLYDDLSAAGATPVVIDAADFLGNPQRYLRKLCDLVDVAFNERMLSWPSGPRDTDGVWARHWYARVESSTGFAPYGKTDVTLDAHAAQVAGECRPCYERLHAHRWTG